MAVVPPDSKFVESSYPRLSVQLQDLENSAFPSAGLRWIVPPDSKFVEPSYPRLSVQFHDG